MVNQFIPRMPAGDLDRLMTAIEMHFVKLAECLVSSGWRLCFAGMEMPGIHYNLAGRGRVTVGGEPPFEIVPHTLLITPPGRSLQIEVDSGDSAGNGHSGRQQPGPRHTRSYEFGSGEMRRFVAGDRDGGAEIMLICGYFRASYGAAVDLFASLHRPIVERFTGEDRLDNQLKTALAELVAQEAGSGAMSMALMKVVLLAVLRRSLSSTDGSAEHWPMLKDPKIASTFSDMAARPGAPHSVQTLAHASGLSRSAFMARFSEVFGSSPMAVLRQLRMRRAAALLETGALGVDRIAHAVGYSSRNSFLRAFRQAYGCGPSEYRAASAAATQLRAHAQ